MRWPHMVLEGALVCALLVLFVAPSVLAAMRLQDRSLYMNSDEPGAQTFYRLSFRYMSPVPVGSVELLFCNDPIPYHPCVIPTNMDVSGAELSEQTGETGFTIAQKTTNRLLLTRTSSQPVDNSRSAYIFDNIINPTTSEEAFAIRIKTFASSDGTGDQVDFGSVRGQVAEGIVIETQVPPMLIFCLAEQVEYNCTSTNEKYYSDMGQLSPEATLTAQSEMAVGTNASAGFAIIAVGAPLSAGTNVIESLDKPTPSQPGENQFGLNLVENDQPVVGSSPEGDWANAVVTERYALPNRYTFTSGDLVATSPNVSLMKKFTVSYIVNSHKDLRAGIYTTTINFIASGRF